MIAALRKALGGPAKQASKQAKKECKKQGAMGLGTNTLYTMLYR